MKKITLFVSFLLWVGYSLSYAQHNKMIELHPLKDNHYTLKVGQKVYYSAKLHASVGIYTEYAINDTDVAKFVSDDITFQNKENANLPGGDEATQTFVFEAIKVGKTTITLREMFRNDEKHKAVFHVKVIE
jgi:hypothetical protein